MIAVDGSDGLVMGSGIRCGCPVLLKSFPDICDGAIAGVRILVKSGLINLGPHVPWPQINQAGNVGTLGGLARFPLEWKTCCILSESISYLLPEYTVPLRPSVRAPHNLGVENMYTCGCRNS